MKFSQGYVAHELGLDQSQYSRREKGEIPFVPNEIVKISKLLKISISDLFGEDVQMNQKDVNFKQNVSIVEKLMELYEIRIKEKEEMIALLKSQLNHNNK
jgi:transcriptional regulator with XRE-family HTH domain